MELSLIVKINLLLSNQSGTYKIKLNLMAISVFISNQQSIQRI